MSFSQEITSLNREESTPMRTLKLLVEPRPLPSSSSSSESESENPFASTSSVPPTFATSQKEKVGNFFDFTSDADDADDDNNLNKSKSIPDWIIQDGSEYRFNPAKFDLSLIVGEKFKKWYKSVLNTSNFPYFDYYTKKLVRRIKAELDKFYSSASNPKETGQMTPIERHYLAASIAHEYPELVTYYQKLKNLHYDGYKLGRNIYTHTFKTTFMEFFVSKLGNKIRHVPRGMIESIGAPYQRKRRGNFTQSQQSQANKRSRVSTSTQVESEEDF